MAAKTRYLTAMYFAAIIDIGSSRSIKSKRGREVIPVRARFLEGLERDIVWEEIVELESGFATYEERTRGIRTIPVVLLEAQT